MSLLSTKQITKLRASAVATLMDSAEVYSRSVTRSTSGGSVAGARTLVETTACRILPIRAWTQEQAGATPETQLVQIMVPDTSAAAVGHELDIDGQTYKVTAVVMRAPHILKRLDCTRL